MVDKKDENISCSFCGKHSNEVNKLIKGSYVYICDECVELCQEILDNSTHKKNIKKTTNNLKIPSPHDIKNFLDEYVIGQNDSKKVLAVSIINHIKRILYDNSDIEIEKENVMIIGPSGTGKTLLVKTLAKKLNIPLAICDSTTLSEVGYVGADPDSIIKKLLKSANNDISKAEAGIVFIDEIDKKAKKNLGNGNKDASGEGVQQALLKLIEGTVIDVEIPTKSGKTETARLDTSNILFIVAGAFSGIETIVEKRLNFGKIGFTKSNEKENNVHKIIQEDIIQYGIIPELMGRLPILTQLEKLDKEQLIGVLLNTKNSLIKQYKKLFEIDGIILDFDDSAINYIVDVSLKNSTGVRGLRNTIEDKLIDIQYNIPNYKSNEITNIILTSGVFINGDDPIIRKNEIPIDEKTNMS